ncbi:uncharacterized protein MEPE_02957 [Melanopsichium pennsylvanicum]|uniref:Origin recognition complex subunit 2 n=2 Tax=Melanopsichium pennsylvanicum TaxID=63383 RepID=A0AAJ4XK62_9BASI|nr:conserved hypothetical protein [Melanopsichium pennsylvanicum 4]SNX84249.1 uncharacterized protein MEPE_02957 [Melanopsichium pennsylvanicum]
MARAPAKRRRVSNQILDVEGDDDWQSDEIELSSLPATDDESDSSSSASDSGSESGSEDDVIDMLKDSSSSSQPRPKDGVEVLIPLPDAGEDGSTVRKKRGRPKKEPEPKISKKRGRPRKYAPGEKRPRRSRRKLNPDGSFKKRGRPKKVRDPDAVMMKVPKRRGRPPKMKLEGDDETKTAGVGKKRKVKKEFDLIAGLEEEFDDEEGPGIVPGMDAGDDGAWEDEAAGANAKQDDILARLRRRILYRQQDAELADFVESLGPDGVPVASSSKTSTNGATQTSVEEKVDEGARPGLPLMKDFIGEATSLVPSSEKRKERQPFEPEGGMSALAEAAASAAAESPTATLAPKPKGRPPGSKNRRPDWENHPLLAKTRAQTSSYRTSAGHDTSLSHQPSAWTSTIPMGAPSGSSLVKPTSSDAYFLFNTSKRARGLAGMGIGTSSTLISQKLAALDSRNLQRVVDKQTRTGAISDLATKMYRHLLPVYLAQLLAGYSIIFHGVGSKTKLLTELVAKRIESEGDAVGVVAQGSMKGFKVEDVLAEIERAVGLGSLTLTSAAAGGRIDDEVGVKAGMVVSTLTAARAERIVTRFNRDKVQNGPTRLFLILETFDAPGMQSARFKGVLETLARSKNIHIMATTEHVNSGFIASTTGGTGSSVSDTSSTSFKAEDIEEEEMKSMRREGGVGWGRLTWIWQNISTFTPPLDEMLIMRSNPAFSSWMPPLPPALDLIGSAASTSSSRQLPGMTNANSSSTSGGGGGGGGIDGSANVAYYNGLQVSEVFRTVSETSAISILKSVTTKARALFNLLAKQSLAFPSSSSLSSSAATIEQGTGKMAGGDIGGVAYAELLNKAKRSFLVSNEADFKSLLIEFKDHHLCHISKQGVIRIGLQDDAVLRGILERLKSI